MVSAGGRRSMRQSMKMLHGVEANRAQQESIVDGAGSIFHREGLHEAEPMHILAAMLVESSFAKALLTALAALHFKRLVELLPTVEMRNRNHEVVVRMSFEEGFCRLSRKRHHKAIIRVRTIRRHEMRLLLHAGNHHQHFAEVGLCLARQMHQRQGHLTARKCPVAYCCSCAHHSRLSRMSNH